MNSQSTASTTGSMLIKRGLTLSVAESCTGGQLSKLITDVPGCSAYYKGGVISYSNDVKVALLGVKLHTLKEFGAVSAATAREMADGVKRALSTDASLSVTGIAGPGGATPGKPVGTVFVALSFTGKKTIVKELGLKGSRSEIRRQSAEEALLLLLHAITESEE